MVPKGFFPVEDTGEISGTIEGAQDMSFQSFAQKEQMVSVIVSADPAVRAPRGPSSAAAPTAATFSST